MSSALQVVAARQYEPTYLYVPCPVSPVSSVFDVPQGYHATVQLYEMPAGWCVSFEEELCICCCDLMYFPVPNDCCGVLSVDSNDKTICLPAGRYRALTTDEDGDPVAPAPREVIIKVSIMPGPCPTTV